MTNQPEKWEEEFDSLVQDYEERHKWFPTFKILIRDFIRSTRKEAFNEGVAAAQEHLRAVLLTDPKADVEGNQVWNAVTNQILKYLDPSEGVKGRVEWEKGEKRSWEEDFRLQFGTALGTRALVEMREGSDTLLVSEKDIKSFIRSTRKEAFEEGVEAAVGHIKENGRLHESSPDGDPAQGFYVISKERLGEALRSLKKDLPERAH